MWKLLLTQLKDRACRRMCMLPTVAGVIATIVYVTFAGDGLPPAQRKFAPLVFIAGILFAIAGYRWFKQSKNRIQQPCCQNCSYDLRGHKAAPARCPECGVTPIPFSRSDEHRTAAILTLIPGVLLIFMSVGCLLFTLLFLFLLSNGALSE